MASTVHRNGNCGLTPEQRFWEKVTRSKGCWTWTASTRNGYGQLRVHGRPVYAHRFSYELHVGPLDGRVQLDHTCFNRACVNPDHLRPVSKKQNMEHRQGPQKNSTTGVLGVYWIMSKQRYRAQVKHHRKSYYLGYFDNLQEAEAAVIAKRKELFTHNDRDWV